MSRLQSNHELLQNLMRPLFRWSLGATLVLTAIALWWPESDIPVAAQPAEQAIVPASGEVLASPARFALQKASTVGTALGVNTPTTLGWLPAQYDPFTGFERPTPKKFEPLPKETPINLPPAPTAPPLNYVYMGSMIDPSGRRWTYVSKGSINLPISIGTTLEEGYIVESISAEAIELSYAALNARASIAIPPAMPQR